MTNKKNEHVLYLEERIEWLEKSMIRIIDMAEEAHSKMMFRRASDSPLVYLEKEMREYREIQNKLPVKKIDKLNSDGGEA